jgi:hypothetical protein
LTSPDQAVARRRLGVQRAHPVLAVVGTTAPLEPALAQRLMPYLRAAVETAAEAGAVVVTGGTDSGVFHLLSLALASSGAQPPAVVGVAPGALVDSDGSPLVDDQAPIDPRLTALVRVPGQEWGDETGTLSRVVGSIAGDRPVVVLLAGGGEVARTEVIEHLLERRSLVVLRGSGRLADQIVGGPDGPGDADLRTLVVGGTVLEIDLDGAPGQLVEVLRDLLQSRRARPWRQSFAVLSVLPRFHSSAAPPAPLLGMGAAQRYPQLRQRIEEADRLVFPAFAACDVEARREQNRYRWFTTLAIVGGLLTTVFGALQAWLRADPWPGVVVATLGAATSALTTVARRQGSLHNYLTARLRAERLRSLYFEHVALPPAPDATTRHQELRDLEDAVAAREYGPVPT